ncbi:MAG: dihydrofolate reductase [Saprospiraceae bacterium]|nr:dihydrofolate reductase [Saprospiraceae bacterium]
MRKIVYYVATSLDGFISGADGDVSRFAYAGSAVDQYLEDLKTYDTVIMGRNTYEFGYQYGMQPGQKAYQHMEHYIFSNQLTFENPDDGVHVRSIDIKNVVELKEQEGTDIYLCGGGEFAGWLLDYDLIDVLKIKLNPIVLGSGVGIFGSSVKALNLELIVSETYDQGVHIITYQLKK